MKYLICSLIKIISSKGFRDRPLITIKNSLILTYCLIFNKNHTFKINFGYNFFYFNFSPKKKGHGGRAFLIFKEKIEPLMEFGYKLITHDSVIIDGGSNQGIFSLAFASFSKNIKVFAIEPFQYCHEILNKNIKINKFKNIKIIKNILSNKIAKYNLDYSNDVSTASIIHDWGGHKILKIKSTTIDSIKEKFKLEKIDIIKLDVEGAEILAIKGASKTILQCRPIIVLECNMSQFSQISFLKNLGYKTYLFNNNGFLVKIKKLNKGVPNLILLTNKHLNNIKVF
jgi:FkbM family methyltransferase